MVFSFFKKITLLGMPMAPYNIPMPMNPYGIPMPHMRPHVVSHLPTMPQYVPPALIPTPATASPHQPPLATFPAYQDKSNNGSSATVSTHVDPIHSKSLGARTRIVHPEENISLVCRFRLIVISFLGRKNGTTSGLRHQASVPLIILR